MANPNHERLHPEIRNSGLVGLFFNVRNEAMEANIGRKIRLDNRDNRFGTSGNEVHMIIAVQLLHDKSVGYRCVGESEVHNFGRAIRPSEIAEWLD
jgi:hypothetical protein